MNLTNSIMWLCYLIRRTKIQIWVQHRILKAKYFLNFSATNGAITLYLAAAAEPHAGSGNQWNTAEAPPRS
jgi:hypothetical protein